MIAVSNIAWPAEDDLAALDAAQALGFTGVELAPPKTFGPWESIDLSAVRAFRASLEARGLSAPALQAILFNRPDCKLFGAREERQAMHDHLAFVARIAGAVGARACVFGAPRQRDPGSLSPAAAMESACAFFAALAPLFAQEGSALAFEANAALYDCRFATHTRDAIALARAVDHPGLRLQLDLGTVTINQEPLAIIADAVPFAAHLHISEPKLAPIGTAGTDHAALGAAVRASGYDGCISVEMAAQPHWRANLARARDIVRAHYQ